MKYIPFSISGEQSIPEPFNENDVMIWNDLICKFVCQDKNKNALFNLSEFLNDVILDKILPLGGYDKEMIKKTMEGEKNEFYHLIKHCLEFLRRNRLLELRNDDIPKYQEHNKYFPTERFRSICPQTEKVIMPGIKPLLDAEREIRKDQNYQNTVRLLKHLQKEKEVNKHYANKFITIDALHKLVQLGIITLYLDDRITITTLGELLKPLLD